MTSFITDIKEGSFRLRRSPECPDCGRVFDQRWQLQIHMMSYAATGDNCGRWVK